MDDVQNQGRVKLGIGNDGDHKVVWKFQAWHGPDVVREEFVVKRECFGIVIWKELLPNFTNFNFGIFNIFGVSLGMVAGNQRVQGRPRGREVVGLNQGLHGLFRALSLGNQKGAVDVQSQTTDPFEIWEDGFDRGRNGLQRTGELLD